MCVILLGFHPYWETQTLNTVRTCLLDRKYTDEATTWHMVPFEQQRAVGYTHTSFIQASVSDLGVAL